jgi:tetratricopeptide (TPR) repeat protein
MINKALAPLSQVLALMLLGGCADRKTALERGLQQLRAGRLDKAMQSLGSAAATDARSASAYCNLGVAQWKAGHPDQAADSFRKAAESSPDPLPLEYLGRVCIELGRDTDARISLERALSHRPSPSCLTAMGVLELRAGRYDTATNHFASALALDPAYVPAIYDMAVATRARHGAGDISKEWAGRYLEAAPDGPRAVKLRSVFDDRLVSVLAAKEEPPHSPRPSPPRGETTPMESHLPTASAGAAAIRPAVSPEHAETVPAGTVSGKAPSAAVPPEDTRHNAMQLWAEGLKYHRAGKLDEAIVCYRKALQVDGTFVSASYNIGLAYRAKGDHARARDAFMAAVSVNKNMLDARYMLASSYRSLGKTDKAIDEANKLLGISKSYANAYLLLGTIYREHNRPAKARECLERFVQLDPGNPMAGQARQWLGELH